MATERDRKQRESQLPATAGLQRKLSETADFEPIRLSKNKTVAEKNAFDCAETVDWFPPVHLRLSR